MHANFADSPFALSFSSSGALGGSAFLHKFQGDAAGAIVLFGNGMQCFHTLGVFALADEELWCFFEPDDGYPQNGHNEDEGTGGIPYVAPTLVVGPRARRSSRIDRWICTTEVWNEGPGEETCDELTNTCS